MNRDQVLQLIELLFERLNSSDKTLLSNLFVDDKGLVINNERQSIQMLMKIPPFIGFELKEMIINNSEELLTQVKVIWDMTMPDSVGHHMSYISIVKMDETLRIVSMIDFGEEE